jgi:hypothetical protein
MPSIVSAILLGGSALAEGLNLLTGAWATQWAVYAAGTTSSAIMPDSFSSIDFNADSRVCDYPVEQGAFESYNKVLVPEETRLILTCSGQNMDRDDFLATLRGMRASTNLYDIATPDDYLTNMSLTRYDYKRTAQNGATMIMAECVFEEIRQAASPTYSSSQSSMPVVSSNSPSASSPSNIGTVQTFPLGTNPANIGPFQ